MIWRLSLAYLAHSKTRTALSIAAVAIAVAMQVMMLSLMHGTLDEVAARVSSVQADLIVMPSQASAIFSAGAPITSRVLDALDKVAVDGKPVVRRTIPAYFEIAPSMAGQQQRVFGIDPDDFDAYAGPHRQLIEGRVFDHDRTFAGKVERLAGDLGMYDPAEISEAELARACEVVIDHRLAAAGGYEIGDKTDFLGHTFTVCGIVEAGMAGRVFTSIHVLRHIGAAGAQNSSVVFVQSADDIPVDVLRASIADQTGLQANRLSTYRALLYEHFSSIYVYISVASGIALIVSFLFILVTLYTMVIERTRQIGILRAIGASGRFIIHHTVIESVLICMIGSVLGVCLALAGKWGLESVRPLLTVAIEPKWIVLALLVGLAGGLVSSLYPAYRAVRLDPATALTFE